MIKIDKKCRIPHNKIMSAVAFDTLEVSQNLEAAGFTPGQASDVAQVLAKTMGDSVVTQSYLDLRV